MAFNEKKYRKCINHLVEQKTSVLLGYPILFAFIGAGAGMLITHKFFHDNLYILVAIIVIGALIGILIGLSYSWEIEMKIQEASLEIEILQELKNQSSNNIAKTIVAIENKPNQSESK